MERNEKLLTITFFVGFIGDLILQIATRKGIINPFLKDYFDLHGSAESMTIGGGMMVFFYIVYLYSGLPLNYLNLAIYGIILDFIFRKTMVYKTLTGYYDYLGYFWSAVWGAIPLILPYFIFKTFFKG
jgi:hypothetical protein